MRYAYGSRGFKKPVMKIFAISDLHLSVNNPKPMDIFGPVWEGYLDKIFAEWREKVGEEDIVLLAGDFSWAMRLEDAISDFNLLKGLPGHKIIIRGNHDYWWKSISAVRAILPYKMMAIQNDAIRLDGVVICGTRGWQVLENGATRTDEDKKIYDREVLRLEMTLSAGKKIMQEGDMLICMMHYPPMNFEKEDSEFSALIEKFGVKKVVYGHLHGYKNPLLHYEKNGVEYYLTSCDETKNQLVLIAEV